MALLYTPRLNTAVAAGSVTPADCRASASNSCGVLLGLIHPRRAGTFQDQQRPPFRIEILQIGIGGRAVHGRIDQDRHPHLHFAEQVEWMPLERSTPAAEWHILKSVDCSGLSGRSEYTFTCMSSITPRSSTASSNPQTVPS